MCQNQIPCEVGRSPGDLCALSKTGLIPFKTGPVLHICDQSLPKIRCAVSNIKCLRQTVDTYMI